MRTRGQILEDSWDARLDVLRQLRLILEVALDIRGILQDGRGT